MGNIKLKPKAIKVVCNNCFRILKIIVFYGKSKKPRLKQIERKSQRIVKRGVFNIIFAVNNKNSFNRNFFIYTTKIIGKRRSRQR